MFPDHLQNRYCGNAFPIAQEIRARIEKLCQTKKLLYSKGNDYQN
jgi:hypothetical protein